VEQFGAAVIEWFASQLPAMMPIINEIVRGAVIVVVGLAQAWAAMVEWFMAHWAAWRDSIGAVFSQIGTGAHFALPLLELVALGFREQIGPAIQFVRDHADSLKPVLYALGAVLVVVAVAAVALGGAIIGVVAVITAIASAISFAISHINRIADAFWAVVHAAEAVAGAGGGGREAIAERPGVGGGLPFSPLSRLSAGGIVPRARPKSPP